ncbi:preprotein translocase subunit YajC [Rubricoccus marinus]|uniref:Sec translocon accessory complex subunit YajC n=1 Tax=Rubricoccus marinus TaxID=716817 RepID=A0A259TV33_9BACT|nr:preprotein translocase subunit YajC [Rubricoccus marinus]OZC01625.1 preprotein translocase subunit YajC [Rubricoccus marinus]
MLLLLLLQDAAPGGFALGGLLFPLLILVVFYLFLIRPQQTREKKRRAMIDELKKGDRVVTAGGIHGTVLKVEDTSLLVEVDQNTKLRFEKNAVTGKAA